MFLLAVAMSQCPTQSPSRDMHAVEGARRTGGGNAWLRMTENRASGDGHLVEDARRMGGGNAWQRRGEVERGEPGTAGGSD